MSLSRSSVRRAAQGAAFALVFSTGWLLGTAAQLGSTIGEMQTHVNELQKNLEVLNKIKGALGG